MTDPDQLDELASAHLDGTTSPEEAAEVDADPSLRARVVELRAVRAAVGALPPVDAARRDVAIAAALAAFEEGDSGGEVARPARGITSLAAVAARRGPSPRALRLVGVAAAVLLLAALVPLLGRLGRADDAETADRSPTSEDTGGAAADAESATAAGSAVPEDSTTTAAAPPTDLGHFDDLAALVASVSARASQEAFDDASLQTSYADTSGGCLSGPSSDALTEGGSTISLAIATVAGDAVDVLIVTDGQGARSLQVFLTHSCALLTMRSL